MKQPGTTKNQIQLIIPNGGTATDFFKLGQDVIVAIYGAGFAAPVDFEIEATYDLAVPIGRLYDHKDNLIVLNFVNDRCIGLKGTDFSGLTYVKFVATQLTSPVTSEITLTIMTKDFSGA